MRRAKALALAGLGAAALIVVAVMALPLANLGPVTNDRLGGAMTVKLVIKVHRTDGTSQTYIKEGDLILRNFANILINMLFMGCNDPDNDQNWVNANGNSGCAADFNENSKAQIVLGTGNTAPALSDYKLSNQVISFPIQDVDVIVNGNDMTLDIFGSYTVNNAYNITEVGLQTLGTSHGVALIFHDVLTQPIHLNAGDGITIHYYLTFNNP